MRIKRKEKASAKSTFLSLITLGAILISISLFLSGLIQNERVVKKYTWPKPGEAMFGGTTYILFYNNNLSVNESSCTENESFIGKWKLKDDSLYFDYPVYNTDFHLGFKVFEDSIISFDKKFVYYLMK